MVNLKFLNNTNFEEVILFMSKKFIGILMTLTLLCTTLFTQMTFATDNSDSVSYDVTNFDVAQLDIEKAAGAFLLVIWLTIVAANGIVVARFQV
jgi:hypothetical protein